MIKNKFKNIETIARPSKDVRKDVFKAQQKYSYYVIEPIDRFLNSAAYWEILEILIDGPLIDIHQP